jgi:hypothetical protein
LLMAREAVALVAAGASPRVVLAGLLHADQILIPARRFALERGVRVNRLAACDGTRVDLVIEPIRD